MESKPSKNEPDASGPSEGGASARRGRKWNLTVLRAHALSPRMRRVQLGGEELQGFECKPAQELILFLPLGSETVKRHYTISNFDRTHLRLDIDVVLHGDSPGGRWASNAKPGDAIVVAGPRGRIAVDETASWHLFVGDETALPAMAAMLREIPTDAQAHAFIEVAARDEVRELPRSSRAEVSWLVRGNVSAGHSGLLADAIARFTLPPGQGHAYIMGETNTAKAIRNALRERGMDRSRVSAEGYWRHGRIGGHDHLDD